MGNEGAADPWSWADFQDPRERTREMQAVKKKVGTWWLRRKRRGALEAQQALCSQGCLSPQFVDKAENGGGRRAFVGAMHIEGPCEKLRPKAMQTVLTVSVLLARERSRLEKLDKRRCKQ